MPNKNFPILPDKYDCLPATTEFLKAKVVDGKVTVLSAQASSMLSAFTDANAQVYIPWDVNELREGERVKCYLF